MKRCYNFVRSGKGDLLSLFCYGITIALGELMIINREFGMHWTQVIPRKSAILVPEKNVKRGIFFDRSRRRCKMMFLIQDFILFATFLIALLAMLTIRQTIMDVNWLNVLSVAGVLAVIYILTSISGLLKVPETNEK